jgi:hypothetical protein
MLSDPPAVSVPATWQPAVNTEEKDL